MTTTADTIPPVTLSPGRPGPWRFVGAFLVGLLAALVLAAAGLYLFDRQFAGRILPGVSIGTVDLSGLAPGAAREKLEAAYGGVSSGVFVLTTPAGERAISYAQAGRRADLDAMVADAVSYGRTGSPLERLVGNARTALRGVALDPRVVYDAAALAAAVEAAASTFDVPARNAFVETTEDGFRLYAGENGRRADRESAIAALAASLGALDTPSRLKVALPLLAVEPNVTTIEATIARAAAERIAVDVVLAEGDESWSIPASAVRSWISFVSTPDGSYQPFVDTTNLPPLLEEIAKKVVREPKDASFLLGRNGEIVGVTAGANGRALDVGMTTTAIADALRARAARVEMPSVAPALVVTTPALSTEDAEKVAPLMAQVSTWTTYFPISEKNGFGANIWIPAKLIDGYVVAPGATFDFWKAIGPVTREKGYKDGGAIINGRTEPQGALAGGICSCSTTLFNAALRGGYKMGARRNHYYYIDRYPLGLDATVFISGSGSRQTMSFTNDTEYPILIRGINTRKGNAGYVRFDLYSVPNDRKVSFSKPIVKNIKPASDSVQYTSTLPAGTKKRIEHPVDGKDVWVTRTVTDSQGHIVHKETYYSHYARITGIVLIGTGGVTPSPDPAESSPPPA